MSSDSIHPTAIISPKAQIGDGVTIGPFCIVNSGASIGDGCILHSHVVMDGNVEIGKDNQFFPFCSIGLPPQDVSYKDEPTKVVIGEKNIFREYVSVHRATTKDSGVTFVGSHSFFMSGVHLAHDIVVKDHCILASAVILGGHVKLGNNIFVGGLSCFKPFVQVGRGAYIGGGSVIDRDVPSFCTAYGNRLELGKVNIVGMRRQGFAKKDISQVVQFYSKLEASEESPYNVVKKLASTAEMQNDLITEICQSILTGKSGLTPFRRKK